MFAIDPDTLRSLRSDRDDESLPLRIAEQLAVSGDPRAELIFVQCQLRARRRMRELGPSYVALETRERTLLECHAARWTAECGIVEGELGVSHAQVFPGYHRGFVDAVTLRAERLLEIGARLVDREPVYRVRIVGPVDAHAWDAILCCPTVLAAGAIELRGVELSSAFFEALSRASLANLQELSLVEARMFEDEARALFELPMLAQLHGLDLSWNEISPEGVEALRQAKQLASLRTLRLRSTAMMGEGVAALASAAQLSSLENLDLSENYLSIELMHALDKAVFLTKLFRLDLGMNRLCQGDVLALGNATHLQSLCELDVRDCRLGSAGVSAIGTLSWVSRLRWLGASWNDCGDDGVVGLCASPYLESLEALDLRTNQLSDACLPMFATARFSPVLRNLYLNGNDIERERIDEVFRSSEIYVSS